MGRGEVSTTRNRGEGDNYRKMGSVVSVIRCNSYDENEVLKGVKRSIDLIGGIKNFVGQGERVLLKPNLLYGKSPEKAVTTHPSIIKGMIQIVREAGGIPFIGDSPSVGGLIKTAEKAGIKKVADEMDCPIIEFNRPVLSSAKDQMVFRQFEIDRAVLEADVVINLPKLKTHGQMFLTLGVKNLFGCIPGHKKALWHLKAGEDPKVFAEILIDLYKLIRPSLTILDGIVGMEGNGPNSGDPIPLGLILASPDPLSIDQIVCDLLGINRNALMTNRVAFERGIGREEVEVFGERLEDVRIGRFKFPSLTRPDWNLPPFVSKSLKNLFTSKPSINENLCKSCDQCIEICPPKAIKKINKGLSFDYNRCIRCFCCQEVCPEGAISIKPGLALKLFTKDGKG